MAPKVKAQSQIEVTSQGDESEQDVLLDVLNAAVGMSGTKMLEGVIAEEYNQELAGPSGMEVYDKMRRSDAQISAVLMAMELPIRSGFWSIDPARNEDDEVDEADQEIADFIDEAIFSKLKDGWDNKLREILTMFAFGFSVFEKTYTSDGKRIWLDKMGFRKQQTIQRWETKDRTPGVVQILSTANSKGEYEVSIPGQSLVLFTFRKEGDNYQGISVLRSAYKNYYMKDRLYRFDAVKHERQGVGIPVIYIPKNATVEQKKLAANIVRNIRATEQTGIVMPGSKEDGWLFEFANLNAGTGTDLWESIKHHNREIAKNVLAQFLELGDTQSGSKALGSDQSDLFIASLTATANQVCEIMNQYVIKELVDLNYNGIERYPKLTVQRISKQDLSKLSETIATLVSGGVIKTDESIEDYMREMLGLPARSTDEALAAEDGMDDETDMEEDPTADLEKQIETLAASEDDDGEEFADSIETLLEFSEATMEFARGPLTEEHKKAISEALKGRG